MSLIRTAVLEMIRELGTPTVAEVSARLPQFRRAQVQSCVWALSTAGWLRNAGRDPQSKLGNGECRYEALSTPCRPKQKRPPPKNVERTDRKGPAFASVWHYAQGLAASTN